MAELKGDLTAVGSTLTTDSVDHFGSADVNGCVGIWMAAGASGTVILEASGGTDGTGAETWVQIRVFNDGAAQGAYQDTMVGAGGAQHFYAEIVGAKHVRLRKTVTAASCFCIINLKAA